jgi:pimeloyl-ACP methyl ester carboxylesterase
MDGTGLLFEPLTQIWPSAEPPPIVISYPSDRFLDYPELEAFVRPQLPTSEPYCLVAESFGGPLAVHIAAHLPPGLRGLVLSATFARHPRGWPWSQYLVGPYLFRWPILNRFARWTMQKQGHPAWQIDFLLKAITHDRPDILAARLKAALVVDVLADLKHCRVPVLCLYAERDLLVANSCHEIIGKSNPNVRLVGFDTPHYLLQAMPAKALEEIFAFTRSLV